MRTHPHTARERGELRWETNGDEEKPDPTVDSVSTLVMLGADTSTVKLPGDRLALHAVHVAAAGRASRKSGDGSPRKPRDLR